MIPPLPLAGPRSKLRPDRVKLPPWAPSNWPIFVTPTATNCVEFIFLPDPSGTGPLLTLTDLDHAIPRMSAFHHFRTFVLAFRDKRLAGIP